MNRRSPWLAFAACALLHGTILAQGEEKAFEKPLLTMSAAADAAEAELEKRGLSKDHVISDLKLVHAAPKSPAYYIARIYPRIPLDRAASAVLSTGLDPDQAKDLSFTIGMDGTVSDGRDDPKKNRLRVIGGRP
jgi:hypothetical protein